MAKGDGKKSRTPKPPPPPPSPPAAAPAKGPGRVDPNSLLSVRKQIAIVKRYKKAVAAGPAKAPVRTSFRKKAVDEGVRKNRTMAVDEDVEVDMRNPSLFIDGYNVINAWPRLKKRFEKGDLLQAREMLLADVADYAVSRYDVCVVFDANGASDRVEGKDRMEGYAGGLLQVVFAHDSADAYIERETKALCADGRQVQVATSDNGIATASALYGATVVSSRWLVTELKASRNAAAAIVDEYNRQQERIAGVSRPLWDALPSDMQAKWDASIQADVVNKRLTKAQLAAKAAAEDLAASGALERGAAARRRQLEATQKRRGRGGGAPRQKPTENDEKPRGPFDML